MWSSLPTPAIFAHRGASGHAPENTLAAFRLALELGSEAIELDAKLSADGEVVVIHDQSIDRTSNRSGLVKDLTLAQLRQLDVGSWFDARFVGEQIPTLAEVFELAGSKIVINVELTNYSTRNDRLPEKVAALVIEHQLQDSVFFSSFNPFTLKRLRRALPGAPIGLLGLPGLPGAWIHTPLAGLFSPQAIQPHFADVSVPRLVRVHRQRTRMQVYTVNEAADMRRLFALGIGIFTDQPQLAMQIRAEATSEIVA